MTFFFPRRKSALAITVAGALAAGSLADAADGKADLQRDFDIVAGADPALDKTSPETVAAVQRLAASNVIGPFFFGAVDKMTTGPAGQSDVDGVPLALVLAEYRFAREINAALSGVAPDARPSTVLASMTSIVGHLDETLARLAALPPSPMRDRVTLRLEALRALATSATDAGAAMRTANDLLARSLSLMRPDSRSFALSLHALAWAQMAAGTTAGSAADALDAWIGKARRLYPATDANLANADIDVADKASDGGRRAIAIAAMQQAETAFSLVPDTLINASSARDDAELADDLGDPALEAVYRLRFFKGVLLSTFIEDSFRELLLENYLFDVADHPDVMIAAMRAALTSAPPRSRGSRVYATLRRDLEAISSK